MWYYSTGFPQNKCSRRAVLKIPPLPYLGLLHNFQISTYFYNQCELFPLSITLSPICILVDPEL